MLQKATFPMDGATRCVLLLLLPLSNTPTWSCARVWVSCARLTWIFVWCFPPNTPRSSQQARYLYYQGFVRAVQLEYSEALRLLQVRSRFSESAVWYPVLTLRLWLQSSLRKAPQSGAIGFRVSVLQWVAIVTLLTGDVPSRSMFFEKVTDKSGGIGRVRSPDRQGITRALQPYYWLAQAVRTGNMKLFASTQVLRFLDHVWTLL